MFIRPIAAALLLAGGLALAACGGEEPSSAADREAKQREGAMKYAQCMRKEGIDMPDPTFDEDGGIQQKVNGGPDVTPQEMQAAENKCRKLMPRDTGGPKLNDEQKAEMREQALAFAQCMRDHGVDMPDPQFSEDGGMTMKMGGPGKKGGPSDDDADFREAQEACRDKMPRKPGAGTTEGN